MPPTAHVGRPPASPRSLSAGEWIAVFRRSFQAFLRDDCTGLAQQIAYSSLLAFFPATVFRVGPLDLIHAYDVLRDFLAPIAPGAVLETVDTLQQDTARSPSVVAFVVGAAGATWAASGAMGRS